MCITQVVRLNRKFYAASMEEGADLMQHITAMTSLAEQLRELEEEISSRKFATMILGSLPESYDNFVSSLNARTADELNWDNIKGPLIEEYMKRKDKRDQQHSSNDALFTEKRKFPSRGRNTGNYSRNYQAGGQGRPGLRSRDSYDNTRAGRNDREKPRGPKCHKCKQFGHVVKNCPQNKKRGESYIADTDAITEEIKTRTIEDQLEEIALPASTRCELTNGWYVDSGATRHMTFQKNLLLDFVEFNKPSRICVGDNRVISATGEGKVKIPCIDGANKMVLTLEKVLFVPDHTKNLLSVSCIAKNGGVLKFVEQRCIASKEGKNITIGNIVDGKLYRVNTPEFANVANPSTPDLGVWHCRFGHLNHDYVNQLAKKQLANGMKYSDVSFDKECEACALGKMHKLPSPKQNMSRASKPLELIHTNVCGPMNVDSIGGSRYMLTFTDDYSRYTTVYFITSKSETLSSSKSM